MMRINAIKQFIAVFVTIYNFLHFSESVTRDRILSRNFINSVFDRFWTYYVHNLYAISCIN